ncbi:NUDIX hydrolase [Candidatus Nanohalobium constans]|uniref:8-oxo-dGTP diphosphatase n=1 Tax=Candidatus Nanohalobium constans TaxID=2565781 RepID=A0A5Q0UFK6_9ARCH|nr:NUDIX domain-containing protein [Candidatus Nanohalobium constans]QGA80314.1 8-oxo-dGTP diphosphatase [Candidatus Nanohalobium constans]
MTAQHRVVVNGIITCQGEILLGKKKEVEGHPISGEWHFPGGHLDEDEEPEEGVVREIKEETGLDVEVHQIVDATANTWRDTIDKPVQIMYHVEAENKDAEAMDDLEEVKWVNPEKLKDSLDPESCKKVKNREEVEKFLKRIEKAPY